MLDKKSGRIYLLLYVICTTLLVSSVFFGSLDSLLPNFYVLQTSSQRLYTDSFVLGHANGTLLNAGILGMVGMATVLLARIKATGFTVACIFLIIGFGFAGMTVLGLAPIVLGTWLFAKFKKVRYKNYAHEALLAFGLSPIVNQIAFGNTAAFNTFGQYIMAGIVGIIIGLSVPPIAYYLGIESKQYRMQYALAGLGIVGMVFYAGYRTIVIDRTEVRDFGLLRVNVGEGTNVWVLFLLLFLCIIVFAFLMNKNAKNDYLKEVAAKGNTDYVSDFSFSSILINIGVVGLISLSYFGITGTVFNGIGICVLVVSLAMACLRLNPLHIPFVLAGVLLSAYTGLYSLNEPHMLFGYAFSLGITVLYKNTGILYTIGAGILFNYLNIFSQGFFAGLNLYGSGAAMGFTIFLTQLLHHAMKVQEKLEE